MRTLHLQLKRKERERERERETEREIGIGQEAKQSTIIEFRCRSFEKMEQK
jgi:hypothetical protein